jgi:molybdenum cofactor cytidylyltransferase
MTAAPSAAMTAAPSATTTAAPPATTTAARPSGLVLAAGGSQRLGAPKQLLPYGSGTLLGHVLGVARACRFDQLLCVVGGGSEQVRSTVDFEGVQVVENRSFGEGCSSSIAAALSAVDPRSEVLVLMLCDQPGVRACTIASLLAGRGRAPLAACLYDDGRGHPLAFARSIFGELGELHGDKGVWRLLDAHAGEVADVPVGGAIPRDVDTWEDYRAVLESAGVG